VAVKILGAGFVLARRYAPIYGEVTSLLADAYRRAIAIVATAAAADDEDRRQLADHLPLSGAICPRQLRGFSRTSWPPAVTAIGPVSWRRSAGPPRRRIGQGWRPSCPCLPLVDREWLAKRIEAFADPEADELAEVGWGTTVRPTPRAARARHVRGCRRSEA
jgi:hypothetical protein